MNTSQDFKEQMRLTEAKKFRKQAEEDFRVLSNRITLLRLEEQKAMKKIEETRRKAQEIVFSRNRNLEEMKKREESRRRREEDQNRRMEQNKNFKTTNQSLRVQANQIKFSQIFNEVQMMKEKKKRDLKTIEANRTLEMAQKICMKNLIKNQQFDAKEKIKRIQEDKFYKARVEVDKKIDKEIILKKERDEEIARMEQEELELIQRLQHTQLMQKTAFEDLESAMNGM
jgi:hypothetical protein